MDLNTFDGLQLQLLSFLNLRFSGLSPLGAFLNVSDLFNLDSLFVS